MTMADKLRELAIAVNKHKITKEDADWELQKMLEEEGERDDED